VHFAVIFLKMVFNASSAHQYEYAQQFKKLYPEEQEANGLVFVFLVAPEL